MRIQGELRRPSNPPPSTQRQVLRHKIWSFREGHLLTQHIISIKFQYLLQLGSKNLPSLASLKRVLSYPHTNNCLNYFSFFKKNWRTLVLFVEPLIPVAWALPHMHEMDSSDSPLVQHLLTSWWPVLQLNLLNLRTCTLYIQELVGLEPGIECLAHRALNCSIISRYNFDAFFERNLCNLGSCSMQTKFHIEIYKGTNFWDYY